MPHPKVSAFVSGVQRRKTVTAAEIGEVPTESELAAERRKTITAAEIGEVPPPPIEPVRPPTFPPLDVSRFLDDALTGVLQPSVPQPREGRPQTFEGQQFVQDFLAQFGVEPTERRVAQEGFQQTGTFDPFSTMGRLGFLNQEQARRAQMTGETFGPLKGAEVPFEGGIVITDAGGNPTDRFFNLDRPEVRQAIEDGRFIQPIFGELAQTLQGGLPGGEDFYNVPIEQPEIQLGRALGEFGTPKMYLKSLSDFLDEKVFRDREPITAAREEIETLKQRLTEYLVALQGVPGFVTEGQSARDLARDANEVAQAKIEELQNQIDNEFFSPTRARREFAKARDIIEFDNPPLEELPFFKEVEPSLLGQATAEQKRVLDERFAGIQRPPVSAPPQAGEEIVQQDFLTYVGRLNLAPEFQRWLLDNFGRLGGLWRQSGEPEFIPWLNKFLSGG